MPAGNRQDGKAPYFGSYREVFSRDLYEATSALLVAGDVDTVRDSARFLLERQQLADGRMPRNSLLNGKVAPDTGGDQLDETAYPILMAYQSDLSGDRQLSPTTSARRPTSSSPRPVVRQRALGGAGRLLAVDDRGRDRRARRRRQDRRDQHDDDRANLYLATADHFQRSIKGWTVTTTGPYAPGRYFIRLSRRAIPTPRSSTTSATAARTPTSGR